VILPHHTLPTSQKAWFADRKSHITYIGIDTVKGTTHINGQLQVIELHNVLHSPGIGGHFFSVLKAGKKGFLKSFLGHNTVITKGNNIFIKATVHGNHYWAMILQASTSVGAIATQVPIEILHAQLGHLSWSSLQRLHKNIDLVHKLS